MSMMNGTVYGRGLAADGSCPNIPYSIIAPTRTAANLAILDANGLRWTEEVEALKERFATADVLYRADFAIATLGTLYANLEQGICCQLLAVAPDDLILGGIIYFLLPPDKGAISLLAIDPRNLAGSTTLPHYRGVGTALAAAACERMLAVGVERVNLHPLDTDAERFWKARGFKQCGAGHLLCVQGRVEIRNIIDNCFLQPEVPVEGDFLLCGIPKQVRDRLQLAQRKG
jgi:GNAT superfamily N-acetyltransferase